MRQPGDNLGLRDVDHIGFALLLWRRQIALLDAGVSAGRRKHFEHSALLLDHAADAITEFIALPRERVPLAAKAHEIALVAFPHLVHRGFEFDPLAGECSGFLLEFRARGFAGGLGVVALQVRLPDFAGKDGALRFKGLLHSSEFSRERFLLADLRVELGLKRLGFLIGLDRHRREALRDGAALAARGVTLLRERGEFRGEVPFLRGQRFPCASARGFEVQRARVSADPDPGVRAALLRNLHAMREVFPDALAVLEERRRADPDAKVRQIADGLLGSTVRE